MANRNDIIQIAGAVEIDNQVKETFNLFCQPFSFDNVDLSALEVNHRTLSELKLFPSPQELFAKLLEIFHRFVNPYDKMDKFIAAGQNIKFDIGFLEQFFIKNKHKYFYSYFSHFQLDIIPLVTHLKYAGLIEPDNLKLSTLCAYFGIEIENAHDALSDIMATRKVLKHIYRVYFRKKQQKEIDGISLFSGDGSLFEIE
jgi:DNA polymerase III epsilon subunit-like protein